MLFIGEQMSWLLLAGVTLIVFGIVVLTQTPESGERSVDHFQSLWVDSPQLAALS